MIDTFFTTSKKREHILPNISNTETITDIVILAGGFGERLWPASTALCPKQFITLSDGLSFLQTSIIRAVLLEPSGKILIVTRPEIAGTIESQVSMLREKVTEKEYDKIRKDLYIVCEPCSRHTCAPILLSCKIAEIFAPSEEHRILVLASDHVISPAKNFVEDARKAAFHAKKGKFVLFAIPPLSPSTEFGYIKEGNSIDASGSVFEIDSFREKPDSKTAMEYLETGKYTWNSGMFLFDSKVFQEEIEKYEKEMAFQFKSLDGEKSVPYSEYGQVKIIREWNAMDCAYKNCKSIAVDKAVAERTTRAAAVRASFSWNDAGSWDAISSLDSGDEGICVDAGGNYILSDLPVSICGASNLVIVCKNGKILVMKKGSSENMRKLVELNKTKDVL